MSIVDGHVHIWPAPGSGSPPLDLAIFPFPEGLDGTADSLLEQMNLNAVKRAIIVQSPWWSHDDSYILELIQRHPGRFTGIGCLPLELRMADPGKEAARIGRDGLSGRRIQVTGPDALEIVSGRNLDPIYRSACDAMLPIHLVSRNHQALPVYAEIARRFPSLTIVIEHFGHVSPTFGATPEAEDALLALATNPLVHVKLAIHHQLSRKSYPWRDTFRLQERLISAFGASRLFWGSNWPMKLPHPSYAERLAVVRDIFPFKTEEDRQWVLEKTAEKLWPGPQNFGAHSVPRRADSARSEH